ncbi:MAG: DUF3267 domain-containing protein [Oscillospiraceae bacterium]|nr:DUF3267 domain-containing protein [Oscillospiraceae bacterium]
MTQAEVIQRRTEQQAVIAEELKQDGFTEEKASISTVKANIDAIGTSLPFAILFLFLFWIITGISGQEFINYIKDLFDETRLFGLPVVLVGFASIPVHEGLHGLGWHLFCGKKWNSIEFGIMKELLTPYCYCGEPLKLSQYYLGLLLPFLTLGVIPSVLGLITGSVFLIVTGVYNIFLAGGDTTIACILVKYIRVNSEKSVKILDHPSECGCRIFLK